MRRWHWNIERRRRAQALIELAVFSAILFYLIGASATSYINNTYEQNARLQTMRRALQLSYKSSNAGLANRSSGSFLIFDDRLTGDVTRYGATDRQPIISAGSGYMSAQVMQTVAFKEVQHLPVMDLSVNGQHFVLRTAGFANYYVFIPDAALSVYYATINSVPAANEAQIHVASMNEEDLDCATALSRPPAYARQEATRRLTFERYAYSDTKDYFYKKVTYADASCGTDTGGRPRRPFDYRRTGNMNEAYPDYSSGCAGGAYWAWKYDTLDNISKSIDTGNGSFPQWDVDGDLNEETLYALESRTCPGYSVYRAAIMASSLGDMDSTTSNLDYDNPYDRPGFRNDMRIYSSLDGTSLDIAESPSKSISTTKKNQNDLVERIYQLNKNMADPDDFISRNNIGVVCTGDTDAAMIASKGTKTDCCGTLGGSQTCFDRTNKRLYIRSPISDTRGRKWITDTSATWQGSL